MQVTNFLQHKKISLLRRNNSRQRVLKKELSGALGRNEFHLVYQPQMDLKSGRVSGFEALLRWKRQNGEMVSPAEFVPITERNGLIIPIGHWVLEEVCRFSNALRDRGFSGIRTGVNISIRQMNEPRFFEDITELIERLGTDPSSLDLEITETMRVEEIEGLAQLTRRLKERGFSISIDDYGTGYSSLSYLYSLQFDRVKIDKFFVDRMLKENRSRHIINSIITLSRKLDIETVAEGVETLEQLYVLKDEQCTQIQGYHFSPPLSWKEALSFC